MEKTNLFTKERIIEENQQHREDVMDLMYVVSKRLRIDAMMHDMDKDIPENAEVLANALNTKKWDEWNVLHLEQQTHHAEWIHNHIYENGANLFDLIEMVVDGCVANLRRTGVKGEYNNQVNFFERKGFDPYLSIVLANTFMILQNGFEHILEEEKIRKEKEVNNWEDFTPYD